MTWPAKGTKFLSTLARTSQAPAIDHDDRRSLLSLSTIDSPDIKGADHRQDRECQSRFRTKLT